MTLSGKINRRLIGYVMLSLFATLLSTQQLNAHESNEHQNNVRRSLMESDRNDRLPRYQSPSNRSSVGLSEAITKARQIQPGEVLGVRRSTDANNRPIYIVKILTRSGVVKKVRVSAGD